MNDNLTTAAWRLKTAIKVRKLSYRKLEQMTGFPRSALHRYATGGSRIPLERIRPIAAALDVSPAWLAGLTPENK